MNSTQAMAAGLLLTALSAATVEVGATVTATATLSAVNIEIIDLDLNDGVVAGITFIRGPNPFDAVHVGWDLTDDGSTYVGDGTHGPLGSAQSSSGSAGAQSSMANVTAGGLFGVGPSVTAFASATADDRGRAYASAYILDSSFRLTPNTQLMVTGTGTASINSTVLGETGTAEASLGFWNSVLLPISTIGVSFTLAADGTTTQQLESPFSVSIVNTTNAARTFNALFRANVMAAGANNLLPTVPENGTVGMMSVGLAGLAGWMLRRCKLDRSSSRA